jgi:zinc transport system substrate-binding protein
MIKPLYLSFRISLFTMLPFAIGHSDQNSPKIVTTLHPISLIAAEIVGAKESITVLVPAGSSAHHYQLKPSHVKALEHADMVIWVGGSLELFMTKVVNNLNRDKAILTLEESPEIEILRYRSNAVWKSDSHHHEHDNDIDGHLWLSPNNAMVIAKEITRRLSELFPDNKVFYGTNLDKFISRIESADNTIKSKLAPYAQTPFLVYHDAFQYFEAHYGLNSLGAFITESTNSLSAKRLSELNKLIISSNIKCIFADRQYDPSVPNKVAAQTGAHVVILDPLGSTITMPNGGYITLLETISENMLSCFDK